MSNPNLSILNKISSLLKEQGKTQKALCEHLGLKQQAFTNWKNNDNDSYMKYLPEIASFFGVSVDQLLGTPSPAEASLLPAELLAVIATFSEAEMRDLENYVHYIVSKRK